MSWESSYDDWKTTKEEEKPVLIDEYDIEIYDGDTYYDIDGIILSTESLDDCKMSLCEDETFVCYICQDVCGNDDCDEYYLIKGEKYCPECIEACAMEAYR